MKHGLVRVGKSTSFFEDIFQFSAFTKLWKYYSKNTNFYRPVCNNLVLSVQKSPNISDYSIFYCFNLFFSLKIFDMFQITFLCFLIMFVFVFIGYLVFSITYRYSNCLFFFFTCEKKDYSLLLEACFLCIVYFFVFKILMAQMIHTYIYC